MPKKLERCIKKVSKTVKPRKKGQSKKSAATAVCVVATGQKAKRKSTHKSSHMEKE